MARVFISYSHKDKQWKDKLLEPLRALERNGLFHIWADDRIGAGAEFEKEIREALDSSDAAVLMISNHFLNSDFIHGKELPRILKKRKSDGMRVLPLLVRPCPWQEIDWLAKMKISPPEARPLVLGDEYDIEQDLADFAREVLKSVKSIDIQSEPLVRRRSGTKKSRPGKRVHVGVVSLEANLRGMPRWLHALSELQTCFEFTHSSRRLPVRAISDVRGKTQLKVYRLRKAFQMEMIEPRNEETIGVARHVLAYADGDIVHYNHLGASSTADDRLSFMSVANLETFAKRARVSMRAAFAYVLTAHLADQMTGIGYHDDIIDCPLDYTEDHAEIVTGMKAGRFCDECAGLIEKKNGAAFLDAFKAMLTYGR